MMNVSINNAKQSLKAGTTVAKALELLGYKSTAMLGIAVNQIFIPKDQWAQTCLQENDQIDILNPISGG